MTKDIKEMKSLSYRRWRIKEEVLIRMLKETKIKYQTFSKAMEWNRKIYLKKVSLSKSRKFCLTCNARIDKCNCNNY